MEFQLTAQALFNELGNALNANLDRELLDTNVKAAEYGLTLSASDASRLAETDCITINELDRITIDKSIAVKLTEKFMLSTYIRQKEYAQTLEALIEVFYTAKDECCDTMTDDEVINAMFAFFERESGGDIDVLCSRDMERLCRSMRDGGGAVEQACEFNNDEEDETEEF